MRLIPNLSRVWHKLWSIRLAVFWGAFSGLAAAWPAFQDVVPLWAFSVGSVVMMAAIAIARVTKQPGLEE